MFRPSAWQRIFPEVSWPVSPEHPLPSGYNEREREEEERKEGRYEWEREEEEKAGGRRLQGPSRECSRSSNFIIGQSRTSLDAQDAKLWAGPSGVGTPGDSKVAEGN